MLLGKDSATRRVSNIAIEGLSNERYLMAIVFEDYSLHFLRSVVSVEIRIPRIIFTLTYNIGFINQVISLW